MTVQELHPHCCQRSVCTACQEEKTQLRDDPSCSTRLSTKHPPEVQSFLGAKVNTGHVPHQGQLQCPMASCRHHAAGTYRSCCHFSLLRPLAFTCKKDNDKKGLQSNHGSLQSLRDCCLKGTKFSVPPATRNVYLMHSRGSTAMHEQLLFATRIEYLPWDEGS